MLLCSREEPTSAAPLPQRTHLVTPPVPDRTLPVANPVVTMEHRNAQFLPPAPAASFATPMAQPNMANLMGESMCFQVVCVCVGVGVGAVKLVVLL